MKSRKNEKQNPIPYTNSISNSNKNQIFNDSRTLEPNYANKTQTITFTNRITSITAHLVSFSPPFRNNPVDLYSLSSLNKSIYAHKSILLFQKNMWKTRNKQQKKKKTNFPVLIIYRKKLKMKDTKTHLWHHSDSKVHACPWSTSL